MLICWIFCFTTILFSPNVQWKKCRLLGKISKRLIKRWRSLITLSLRTRRHVDCSEQFTFKIRYFGVCDTSLEQSTFDCVPKFRSWVFEYLLKDRKGECKRKNYRSHDTNVNWYLPFLFNVSVHFPMSI